MTPRSSTLAWKILWSEEPGRLQSMGSLRVGHDSATSLSLFTFMHWRGNGNPLQCSCLENPRDGGAWWAAVYGASQSQTQRSGLAAAAAYMKNQASLVAQLVKNPPAMQETWFRPLRGEDPLEKENATHYSILAMGYIIHLVAKSQT